MTFYFFADGYQAIILLTSSAKALKEQNYAADLPDYKSDDEIGLLIHSINDLKDNLIEQKVKMTSLFLWKLVDQRAKDENTSSNGFGSKNAKFGTIQYSFADDIWTSSEEFDLILGG